MPSRRAGWSGGWCSLRVSGAVLAAVVALLTATPTGARAQCADGTRPPCQSRVRPDSNAFVVLPFRVSGPPGVEYLRESMVDLFHMALDGVGGVRVVYPPAALRRLSALPDPSDAMSAAAVARAMGAGRLIGGSIVATGAELRVSVEVFDAERGVRQFPVLGRGEVAKLGAIVDSLASAILAQRLVPAADRRRRGTSEFATPSPHALQALLVAEQAERRGERRVAAESLKTALQHDPDFGLAHYRLVKLEGVQPGVSGIPGAQAAVLRRALDHAERFPERIRLMLDIQEAYGQGERGRTLALVNQAAARYPNDADAAFQQADKHFHFGLNFGEPRDRVMQMFRRALALDDGNPELLQHWIVLLAESGDSSAVWEALRQCRSVAPAVCASDLGFRAVFRGEDPWVVARALDSAAIQSPVVVGRALWMDRARALAVTDSFLMLRTRPERAVDVRVTAYLDRSSVALARGRYRMAWALLDSARSLRPTTNPIEHGVVLLHNIVTGSHRSEAEDAALRVGPLLGGRTIYAWYAALRQPPDSAERAIGVLEVRAWPDSAIGLAMARGLRGLRALQAGDTVRARELLTTARQSHLRRGNAGIRVLWPGPALALTLARLEAALGNASKARLYLADVYPFGEAVPFLGEAEELRAQVSLALGDTTAAKASYRQVVAIWAEADPEFQPRVAAARAMLARLEGR